MAVETGIEVTSRATFCGSCHSMEPMVNSYRDNSHGGDNPRGITAACTDCHVSHENLMVAAKDMAMKIANNAPLAVSMTKAAMYRGLQEHDLAAHMDHEVYIMSILFGTEDFQEGMKSLWEKRDPVFKGK